MSSPAPRPLARWVWRAAAFALGSIPTLAFPEAGQWWLGYVGLVPLLVVVARSGGAGDAAWRSWLGGTGYLAALHHWLAPSLGAFMVPAALLLGATWVPIGLAAWWLLRAPVDGRRVAAALAVVPSVWVVVEVARSWDVLGGSWGLLGATQWRVLPVLAVAALGGVWALSALLVVCNVAATVAVLPATPARVRAGALGAAGLLVAAAVGWSALRSDPALDGSVVVAGVQPGLIHDPAERLRANERLSATIDAAQVDLVVWGQSSVGFDPAAVPEVGDRLEAVADRLGTDVLVNIDARRPGGRISKTATLVRPGVGLDDTYRKQRLVPFGEYIPLRSLFGWVAGVTEAAEEDRVPGTDVTVMRSAGLVFGPLISYESTFPDMRRAVAGLGAELTIVQAASTTFQGSWAQPQQASYEAVRAVESGRPAVMVAVSGTSAAFDARGRRLAWLPADETGVMVVEVPLSQEATLYVRAGDWVPVLALLVVLVAGASTGRTAWQRRGGGDA